MYPINAAEFPGPNNATMVVALDRTIFDPNTSQFSNHLLNHFAEYGLGEGRLG